MAPEVIDLAYDGDFRLRLTFEDHLTAVVDFAPHLKGRDGVCRDLQDPTYFSQARVDHGLHTIVWPNGYDIDPEVLYSWASGKPIAWAASDADPSTIR